MQVVQHLDEGPWREFVDYHPQGNIFHTPEMFQVFAKTAGYRPALWAVVDSQSEVLALIMPVHITLLNGLLRRLTTRSVVYGSVLYDNTDKGREALRLLLETYAQSIKGRSLFTELRNLNDLSGLRPLLEGCGYAYEDHLNYLIDLSRLVEEILQSIGARTRKNIRGGLRRGDVKIAEVAQRAELTHWYEVLHSTYDHVRVPLADRSLFEAAFDILHPKGMVKFLSAQIQGVTAACSLELQYKETIYGWYGGSDRAYSRYLPNEMLVWHVLVWGANRGYRLYDFGGAGKPNQAYGVRDFKAKFGGELVNFGRYTCVHAPHQFKLSRVGYQLYRRFRYHGANPIEAGD